MAARRSNTRSEFKRFVMLSEDEYRSAVRCLEKNALERTMEHAQWYERPSTKGGVLHPIEQPQLNNVGNGAAAANDYSGGGNDNSSGKDVDFRTPTRARFNPPGDEHDRFGHVAEHGVPLTTTPAPAPRTPATQAPQRPKRAAAVKRAATAAAAAGASTRRLTRAAVRQRLERQDGSGLGRLIKCRILRVYR